MASFYADIVITNRCNFRCKHCDCGQQNRAASGLAKNWKADSELSVEQWMTIFERWKVQRVWLRGIEPLLYPDLGKLMAAIHHKPGLRLCGLTTNGWLIDKHFDDLVKYCEFVVVSIDGIGTTHDGIRGTGGAYQKASEGLFRLKKAGKNVLVSYAITPVNAQDMIPLYDKLTRQGVAMIFNHYNYIHPGACKDFGCEPTNMDVFKPRAVDISGVLRAVEHCKTAQWSPELRTRKELREYYRTVPSTNYRAKELCNVLRQQAAGVRAVIAADGRFILSHRCWLTCDLGNALTSSVLPRDRAAFQTLIKKLLRKGFPPPCQRLCCAGKMV